MGFKGSPNEEGAINIGYSMYRIKEEKDMRAKWEKHLFNGHLLNQALRKL